MARLNASGPPVPIAISQTQDEEEIIEEAEGQGETQFSLLLREQLKAELDPEEEDEENEENEGDKEDEEDEEVSENVLDLLNKATSTPRVSNRASNEDVRQHNPPMSIGRRFTGLFSEGLRLLSAGSEENDNDINEDTSPADAIDDTMQPPSTTTSASKGSKKLPRPRVLHQPLDKYKPSPQSSGKPDVYDLNASPEKAASTPTRTKSKQAQGVKRKRNNPAPSKKPPPRGKPPGSSLPTAVSKVSEEELQSEAPHRVTRSRGSGEIVEPIDYSKKVEDAGKRKRTTGAVDDEPPSKDRSKRTRKVVENEDDELEDGDEPSTPGRQGRAEGDIPVEQPTSPHTLRRAPSVDELPETTNNASDKGSQFGAAFRPSDATAGGTKKGKNTSAEDKEESDDQEYQDDGDSAEHGDTDEEPESVGEGMSPIKATNSKRKPRGERQVSVKSSYFGDDFIAASNIQKVINQIDRLEMAKKKDDTESLKKADTAPGQEIQVLTRSIISSYESIQGLDEHDEPEPAARSEALCSAAGGLVRLEATVRRIIEEGLCDPGDLAAGAKKKDVEWRTKMLQDLFLFAMPDIIRAASAAIFTYGSEGAPSTPDLKEILRYISLVSDLLLIVEEPYNKGFRPRARHNANFPILKPYVSIKPLLRGFETQCKRELKHREEVEEAIRQAPALERARKEREAARKEQEAAERAAADEAEMEYQRRQDAIHDQFNLGRMKEGLPPVTRAGTLMSQSPQPSEPPQPPQPQQTQELNITAHRIRAEKEVSVLEKEVAALTMELEAAKRRATKLRREEQRQLRGYDAEETQEVDYERVEMFPAGNNHATPVEPWTKTECEVLLDGLKLESGPDKYPNIAKRLDRSLDEIFEKAMEFKRLAIENLYMKREVPVDPWVEIIGNEMLPRGRRE